jgi:DnaK suppressor protein
VENERSARIVERRESTAVMLAATERDVARIVAAARLDSGDDEHDPEGATIAFERAQAQALAERLRHQLDELDQALARIADGTYGRCEICGEEIAPERLDARPTARRCVKHAD